MGVPFLYLYVIASRLGEEAAILEGILLERFETLLSPILGYASFWGSFSNRAWAASLGNSGVGGFSSSCFNRSWAFLL